MEDAGNCREDPSRHVSAKGATDIGQSLCLHAGSRAWIDDIRGAGSGQGESRQKKPPQKLEMKLDDRKLWRVRHTFTLKASAGPEKGRLLTDRDHVDDRESL